MNISNIKKQLSLEIHKLMLDLDQAKFNLKVYMSEVSKLEETLNKYLEHSNKFKDIPDDTTEEDLLKLFTKEELKEYSPKYAVIFEPNITFTSWLDWFFEEVPFIKDKNLTFKGKHSNKDYSISNIPLNTPVRVDTFSREIYIMLEEPVIINLGSINLFTFLSIEHT